ncbi:cytochrome c [Thauera sp. 2A1]|uniref:cytochrome c n=1 Tax=Thauera sp. 2A1 TaxID=2570191 RepID=UPI00129200C8|nr:cytochrome c [Thauera sp. 2A1]KAI5914889.1 cytochrome c [Thauera sp. 2A1]
MTRTLALALMLTSSLASAAGAPVVRDPGRGELLYATHCDACHNVQVHWRDKKAATDWKSLAFEVRRWQGVAGLGWSDADVAEVVRYLNARHYHFAPRTP